jgi:hypothetical protein
MTIRTSSVAAALAAIVLIASPFKMAWAQPAPPDNGAANPIPGPGGPDARGPDSGGPAGPGDRSGRGARGGGGPDSRLNQLAAIHQAMADSDDEFAVLEPKISAVLDDLTVTQSDAETLYARGPRGRRGGPDDRGARDDRGGPAGPPPDAVGSAVQNPVQAALTDLQTALTEPDVTPDTIKAKVDAYHAALIKAREKLTRDRADLQSVLTQKQEAVMIVLGIMG